MGAIRSCVLRDFPDAAELRVRTNFTRSGSRSVDVVSLTLRDGQVLPGGDGTIHTDNWQHKTDAANIIPPLSVHLGWLSDGYFYREHGHGYDPETGDVIVRFGPAG